MTTIRSTDPASPVDVRIESTRPRVTPRPAAARFRDTLDVGVDSLLAGVEGAAAMIPAGSVVSAAIRGARSEGAAESARGPAASSEAAGMDQLRAGMMDDSMQYLRLQQQMQAENQRFTTLSNVMKARHETAKNAINNIR